LLDKIIDGAAPDDFAAAHTGLRDQIEKMVGRRIVSSRAGRPTSVFRWPDNGWGAQQHLVVPRVQTDSSARPARRRLLQVGAELSASGALRLPSERVGAERSNCR